MPESQIHQVAEAVEWLHVQSTVATQDDAMRLSHGLVEARLAACVQIQPGVESVYSWQGKIEREPECVLSIKTHLSLWESLLQWFDNHHPYDCPQVTALPLTRVAAQYETWLREQLLDSGNADSTSAEGGASTG